ncbi:MAG: hypothetical protein U0163_16885 [Gemmatimonadaceae bacterium]
MAVGRSFRAVVRNAASWGIAWALAGGAIAAAGELLSPGGAPHSVAQRLAQGVAAGVLWGVRFGLAGAVIGTAFSSVVRWRYRGRRLSDISPVRFGLLGAVVGGVGVPLFLQLMNVLSGDGPVAWGLVLDDARWASVFGAIAAAGSILVARRVGMAPDRPPADGIATGERVIRR